MAERLRRQLKNVEARYTNKDTFFWRTNALCFQTVFLKDIDDGYCFLKVKAEINTVYRDYHSVRQTDINTNREDKVMENRRTRKE